MYFIITGTSQHFGRMVINVDQNNIGLFHQGRYINIRIRQQNEKSGLGFIKERSGPRRSRSYPQGFVRLRAALAAPAHLFRGLSIQRDNRLDRVSLTVDEHIVKL